MATTETYFTRLQKDKEQGPRGFPGPAGPVSGGTYPGAGIPLSTGSAWGTSITNNSANWNTAYGWGNHASAGYAPLANPVHTGVVRVNGTTGEVSFRISNSQADWAFLADDSTLNDLPAGALGFFNVLAGAMKVIMSGAGDLYLSRGLHVGALSGDPGDNNILADGNITGAKLQTANWSFEEDGSNNLIIKYGSTVVAKLTTAGYLSTKDEQESFDTGL